MTLYAFETEPVTFRYPGGPPLLDRVQFRGLPGTLTVLIGPNGAGKSTLLKILAGTLRVPGLRLTLTPLNVTPPTSHPPIHLEHLNLRDRARYVAYLPQSVVVPENFRVEEVVALGRFPHQRWWSLAGAEDALIIRAALEEADAATLSGRRFAELSGGEQQSVLLASVLAQQAPVMLLDEPGRALDIHHQATLFQRLAAMAAQGRTVVAITHDLNIAARFAGRVVLMQAGHLIADGMPKEVLTTTLLQQAYGPAVEVLADPHGGPPIVIPTDVGVSAASEASAGGHRT